MVLNSLPIYFKKLECLSVRPSVCNFFLYNLFVRSLVRMYIPHLSLFVRVYVPTSKFVCLFVRLFVRSCLLFFFPQVMIWWFWEVGFLGRLDSGKRGFQEKRTSWNRISDNGIRKNGIAVNGICGKWDLGKLGFGENVILGRWDFGKMGFWENKIMGKGDSWRKYFRKMGFKIMGFGKWDFGKRIFGKMLFWENGTIGYVSSTGP